MNIELQQALARRLGKNKLAPQPQPTAGSGGYRARMEREPEEPERVALSPEARLTAAAELLNIDPQRLLALLTRAEPQPAEVEVNAT